MKQFGVTSAVHGGGKRRGGTAAIDLHQISVGERVAYGISKNESLKYPMFREITFIAVVASGVYVSGVEKASSEMKDSAPVVLDRYGVQCGILSSEGLPERANPRFTVTACTLVITTSDAGITKLDFSGQIHGRTISWVFEGDANSNVYEQLEPQQGGKFNRSVRNGLACFVPFDETGLDDTESLICYKRATLHKLYGWNRNSGANSPLP